MGFSVESYSTFNFSPKFSSWAGFNCKPRNLQGKKNVALHSLLPQQFALTVNLSAHIRVPPVRPGGVTDQRDRTIGGSPLIHSRLGVQFPSRANRF